MLAYREQYTREKVEDWVGQVTKLAEFAISHPQANYLAYDTDGHTSYFLRTPLECAIVDILMPSITNYSCTQTERDLLSLPARMGGLGIINPIQVTAY